MEQLLRTVAVLTFLLSLTFVNTVPIRHDETENYLVACGNNNLTLYLPNSIEIGKDYISSPIIRCLTIQDSGIERIMDGAFDRMPNLLYLNLQGNSISPNNLFSFGNLSNVTKLIMSNQRWVYTGEIVIQGIYPQLRYLDLKNTGINQIGNAWGYPFPELTHLDLSRNKIENLSFMRLWTKKLTHLYLNDNRFSEFSLEGHSSLMSLVLDNNNIRTIGDNGLDLVGLTNLKNLSVASNQINVIRDGAFRDTVSLRHLELSNNLLSTIHPDTLKDLYSLQVLVLDQNSFEDVHITIPLNITTLSMNCNHIKYLTINSLYNLRHLKTLSLIGNMIKNVHTDAFQNQGMLEELYLNNNELNYLPVGWCQTMKNLRYLDLSWNEFTLLESVLHSTVPSLRQLYFEYNPLKHINASTFGVISKYVTVYLDTQSNRSTVTCQRNPLDQMNTNWASTL